MELMDYKGICARLGRLCREVRQGKQEDAERLLGDAESLKTALWPEYVAGGRNLEEDCRRLQTADRARAEILMADYRKKFSVFAQIQGVVDDLADGMGDYSDTTRGSLIMALKGLYELCSELSADCFSVFDGILSGEGQTAEELPTIFNSEREKEIFGKALAAGKMVRSGDGYKWGHSERGEKAALAYFVERLYLPEGVGTLPEKQIDNLFSVHRIGGAITALHNAKKEGKQKWKAAIDELFQ